MKTASIVLFIILSAAIIVLFLLYIKVSRKLKSLIWAYNEMDKELRETKEKIDFHSIPIEKR